ncbi:MAG: hypothetical protein BEN19_01460 [Epulopiscium sp. Nuni2H_MBin003]|nr:MAG: hypothetical protein BEN19_01460 [Epulopiscium sp. Nuni2H_MBin003]
MKIVVRLLIGCIILILFGIPSLVSSYYYISVTSHDYFDELYGENTAVFMDNMLGTTKQSNTKIQPIVTTANIPEVAEIAARSVVSITTIVPGNIFSPYGVGLGSGVIFYKDETNVYILTNAHVVDNATNLVVTSEMLGSYQGRIIGIDILSDIAVVAINLPDVDVPIAKISEDKQVKVGDIVIAIGNPIDTAFYNTVTMGVVSALNRQTSIVSEGISFIQTDAAINPGNSGGALVSMDGYLVGINTAKLSSDDIEGIGFAIPMQEVLPIAYELMQNGEIKKPTLGVYVRDVEAGVYIEGIIEGGSAQNSGLQQGDIITKINNESTTTVNTLKSVLNTYEINDSITVTVIRNNRLQKFKVILQEER